MYDDHGIGDWPGGAARDYVEGLGCFVKGFVVLFLFAGALHLLTSAGKWVLFEVIGPTGCLVALLVMCAISVVAVVAENLIDIVDSLRHRRSQSRKRP